jgi:hypothetical protein
MKTLLTLAGTLMLSLSLAVHAASDAPLDPQQRTKAIQDIATQFDKIYFDPEVGRQMARELRARLQRGEYEAITSSRELANVLSKHIDAICKESHTGVSFHEEDQLASLPAVDPAAHERHEQKRLAALRAANFYFAPPKRLEGNIALIRFDGFARPDEAQAHIDRLMSATAGAAALVFDLRETTGGASELIPVLASYLFDDKPVHLFDRSDRKRGSHARYWTTPAPAAKRFGSRKPVYVLVSKKTFSAAEHFAYTLQQLERATVVGEKTRGGNHGAFGKPVTPHLVAHVATISTINAVSGTDFGQGVLPDLAVPAAEALPAALAAARAELVRSR